MRTASRRGGIFFILGCLLPAPVVVAGHADAHAGEPSLPAIVTGMQQALSELRGHPFRVAVPVTRLSGGEVQAFISRKLAEEYTDEQIASEQAAYRHFGFLGAEDDLRDLFVGMMADNAAGFYDADEKRLFLVQGRSFPGIALVHELAHALQDQTFGVDRIIAQARANDDALLAVQSMIEGEAMILASLYTAARAGQPDPLEGRGDMPAGQRAIEQHLESRRGVPWILEANMIFPYRQGMAWAAMVRDAGGFILMDEMFRHPPESTEQIIHPEKARAPRDLPSSIDRSLLERAAEALPAGWRHVKTNTLGEFNLSELLGGRDVAAAMAASAGWDGDLYAIHEAPGGGTALVWITVWDTPADADEFIEAAGAWLERRHPAGDGSRVTRCGTTPTSVCLIEGLDASLAGAVAERLGERLAGGVSRR